VDDEVPVVKGNIKIFSAHPCLDQGWKTQPKPNPLRTAKLAQIKVMSMCNRVDY